MRILLLNGPNLGRLGKRQPEIYGSTTLTEVEAAAAEHARTLGHTLSAMQSNHEGGLIDRIEQRDYDAIVINPGALTHYGYSLHDALLGTECPIVEVHISDIMAREEWRHVSIIEP
ncbi:MAG: type II 3-dehydroquinate dehydratase, partial [Chloroflexota bacterium]|nr:type II 3-dehydroquinate dehydratase [Chloroflexota bacterium]